MTTHRDEQSLEEKAKEYALREVSDSESKRQHDVVFRSALWGLRQGEEELSHTKTLLKFSINEKCYYRDELETKDEEIEKLRNLIMEAHRVFSNAPDGWAKTHTQWLLIDLKKIIAPKPGEKGNG